MMDLVKKGLKLYNKYPLFRSISSRFPDSFLAETQAQPALLPKKHIYIPVNFITETKKAFRRNAFYWGECSTEIPKLFSH